MIYTIEQTRFHPSFRVDIYLSPTDLKNTHIHTGFGIKTRQEAEQYGEWWISESDKTFEDWKQENTDRAQ